MIQYSGWWLFAALMPFVYWRLPAAWRPQALSIASITVLIALAPFDVLLMLLLGLYVYAAVAPPEAANGKLMAALGRTNRFSVPIILILAYLFWYKYLIPYGRLLAHDPDYAVIAVPLGISYFTFKLIHYALERQRRMLPAHGIADYLSWLFLMPTFASGPIERFEHFVEHRETVFRRDYLIEGGMRIAIGLIKKFAFLPIIVGATFNIVGDDWVGFAHGPGGLHGAAKTWAYLGLELATFYLDFSAYSDIAIGMSRLFGLRIMENFNYPMLATNLVEFWRRYHMSLTGWARAYIFMPMLGRTRNPYIAMVTCFVVIGLWHAGWLNWLAWGLWHGAGQAIAIWWGRYAQRRKIGYFKTSPGRVTGWAITMAYVMLGGAFEATRGHATTWDALCMMGRAFGV